jgi:hypothetical protein
MKNSIHSQPRRTDGVMKKLNAFLLALVAIVSFLVAPAALAAPATQLKITVGSSANVGVALSFQVQALDSQQFIDTGFAGTVDFGSSDDFAGLPAAYTFAPSDAGVKTFSVTFRSIGSQTVSVFTTTDPFIRSTSSAITVAGGTASTFTVTAPATANLNTPVSFTVAAKDAFGNAAAAYAGTVRFTSTDLQATLPASSTLTNGSGTFQATFKTLGSQTITATDTVTATLTATSSAIVVGNTPGQITPSPASLDFGGQSMKTTTPAKTITLTNTGGSATTINSITTSTYFTVASHNCTTLIVGASCTASVTFTPTAEGSLNGTLTITRDTTTTQTVPLLGVGEKSLVTHYYLSILRRASDAGGKSFWNAEAARMAALGTSVNETWYAMSASFFFSPEYVAFQRNDADFVTDLYNTFFNRAPDPTGFADWTSKLAQGMPREVVGTSFMFSPEFTTFTQSIFGTATVRPEIDMDVDFYRGLLGRLPDDAGFNSWLVKLRNAQCSGAPAVTSTVEDISSQFALSAEYVQRNRSNSQYVGDLYNAFLRRGGDLAGVLFWIDQIASGKLTREQVRKAFVASPEFTARVNAVIAAGTAPGYTCNAPGVDYDINNTPIPSPTAAAGSVMCDRNPVTGASGPYPGAGPGPCGSYEIPLGTCSSGMTGANAITRAYQYNLEDMQTGSLRLGNSIRLGIPRDAAMVFRFRTGPASAFPEFNAPPFYRFLTIINDELPSRGPPMPHFGTVTEARCDFDYSKTLLAGTLNGCYVNLAASGSILTKIWPTGSAPTAAADFPFCPLKPDTTYYLNIRYEDASTLSSRGKLNCPEGTCGATVVFN